MAEPKQRYISKELTHFVGQKELEQEKQYEILEKILKEGVLTSPSKDPECLPNYTICADKKLSNNEMFDFNMVCFCDIPIGDLGIHIKKYSKFGLSFTKDFIASKGGCPMFYIPKNAKAVGLSLSPELKKGRRFDNMGEIYKKILAELPGGSGKDMDGNKKNTARVISGLNESFQLNELFQLMIFLGSDFLSYVKCFDHNLPDDDPDNYYFEREWRISGNLKFKMDDVQRILIPKDYSRRFREDFPKYYGELSFTLGKSNNNLHEGKLAMCKPNIFSFATSELSQDAFICWLVSHINHPKDTILHECAKDFIVMLYNLERDSDTIDRNSVSISMSSDYPKQQHCKTDVSFQVSINGKIVSFIIECKTHTSHHSDQLRRYREAISKDKYAEDEIVGIYYKTGYMFPHDKKAQTEHGYKLLGYEHIHKFLQRYSTDNVIFESYKEFIKEKYFDHYEQNKNRWKDGDRSCFKYDFAQCEYLLNLSEKCKETTPLKEAHIYGGSNPGGSPWTQFRFVEIVDVYCKEVNEYVFYRLDKLSNDKYYLSVRQYANIKDRNSEEAKNLKQKRLERYREIFTTINTDNLKFHDKLSNRGVNESEIAVLFFDGDKNTPNNVLEVMSNIHAAFVERIKTDSELIPSS